jgi:hypothetical protein
MPLKRFLNLGILVVVVAATGLGCGSGNDSADELAQQEAIREARREGARDARLREEIRQLKREVREQQPGDQVPSAPQSADAGSYVAGYVRYQPSDPNYFYTAEIPSGGGWSAPLESHPTSGELLRTSLQGPDGTLLIIDRTPNEGPSLGGSFDAARTVSHPIFGQATEYTFSRSEALPDCNGRPCVDFLINDGSGGGWGVLAGGPSLPVAESIASHVAQSISLGG